MKKPFSILFVCTGNICRSPTAEAVFRQRIQEAGLSQQFRHDSAGVDSHHIGQPPDPRSREALKTLNITMDDLRARNVRPSDFHEFDLILAMDRSHLRRLQQMKPVDSAAVLALYLPYAYGTEAQDEVPDPYYGTRADFEHVRDMIADATEALIERLVSRK